MPEKKTVANKVATPQPLRITEYEEGRKPVELCVTANRELAERIAEAMSNIGSTYTVYVVTNSSGVVEFWEDSRGR